MSESDIRDTKQVMEYVQNNVDTLARRMSNLESISSSPQVLSRVITPTTISNSIAEATLASETLPGKSLRTSNFVEMFAMGRAANPTAGAVNFTWRLKYGSATLVLGPFSIPALTSSNGRLFNLHGVLKARNSLESQQQFLASIDIGADYNVFTTNGLLRGYTVSDITQDSTVDQPVVLTIQHGTAGTSIMTTLIMFKLGAPQVAA